MTEVSVRFGVKDESGLRSGTWKCWANTGTGRSDVYLVSRALGKALKSSLHESGEWNVGFIRQFLEKEVPYEGNRPPSRFIDAWPRPKQIEPGVTLAYQVVIPRSAVSISINMEPSNISWIPAPPHNKAVEIAVLITEPGAITTGWPGHRSMATELLGKFTLDNNSTVWLVHYVVEIPQLGPVEARVSPFESGKSINLDQSNLQIVVFGEKDDGSRYMMECSMEITESGLEKLRSMQSM